MDWKVFLETDLLKLAKVFLGLIRFAKGVEGALTNYTQCCMLRYSWDSVMIDKVAEAR